MDGAWGLGIFQSDYDYDIINELTFQAGVGRLAHVDVVKSNKKPIYILEMYKEFMFKPETGLGSSQKVRNLEHDRADGKPKSGEVYYSIYAKPCSDPNRVRDHMDDGALEE